MLGKSMKVNAVLNGLKTMMSILFPLITFPYASRVLQVENLGKVNFSSSIISYFMLLASLGISTYAIREGSMSRDDSKTFDDFANQVFTINFISTSISYLILLSAIMLVPVLNDYKILLFIQSITIIFTTIGVDWVFSIYEDYMYITIRSLVFQFISMLLLFVFVKEKNDYYIYAMITVISSAGSNILNYLYSRKYFKVKLTKEINVKKHLKPILIIFSTSIATTIYVNSDLTMLGVIAGNYEVGLYSVSAKVYTIIKTVLSAVIIVTLPRLSFYISSNKEKNYRDTVIKIFNALSLIILPTVVGINLLTDEIILIISDNNYIEANMSLRILSIALIFSIFGSFTTTSILLPMKKEKYILIATVAGAIVNVLFNLILIPLFQQNGAASTTAIAELMVFLLSYYYARKYFKLTNVAKNLVASFIGCLAMIFITIVLKYFVVNTILYTISTIIFSIVIYLSTLLLLKNDLTLEFMDGVKRKFKK